MRPSGLRAVVYTIVVVVSEMTHDAHLATGSLARCACIQVINLDHEYLPRPFTTILYCSSVHCPRTALTSFLTHKSLVSDEKDE